MTIRPILRSALPLGILLALSFSLHAQRSTVPGQIPEPTVVRIDKTLQGIAYMVDSRSTGHTATTDILHVLSMVKEKRGPDAPVLALVDSRVSFADVWNFEGVAAKAQLRNLRVFVFNHETDRMAELKWGPTVPYSTKPN